MTSFDKREKAFEDKYKHDLEVRFKVGVRRNKLLGHWIAKQLDLKGADAAAYAKEVITVDFDEPGDDDVVRKVLADLEAKSVDISEHRLRKKMDELTETAKQQIMRE